MAFSKSRVYAVILSLVVFLVLSAFGLFWIVMDTRSAAKFDAVYDEVFSDTTGLSRFRSAHASLTSELPKIVQPANNEKQWREVHALLTKNITVIEKTYEPLVSCLSSHECKPGKHEQDICKDATAEWNSYKAMAAAMAVAPRIIDLSSDDSIFGDALSPGIRIPDVPSLRRIVADVCRVRTDLELRDAVVAAKGREDERRKKREIQWDEAMCPALSSLVETVISQANLADAVALFPTPPQCMMGSRGGHVECKWINPIEVRGRYIGVISGGGEAANLDVIEKPLQACFRGKGRLSEDVRIETERGRLRGSCPFIIRRYLIPISGRVYSILADIETCNGVLAFTTTLKLDITESQ